MKKSLALLAVLLLAGCASVHPDPHAADTGNGTENYESLDLGTPQTIWNRSLTVNSFTAVKGDLDDKNTADSLPEGEQYARIAMTLQNETDQDTAGAGPLNFKLIDAEGNECSQVMETGLEGNLVDRLPASGQLSGEYVFEVPVSGELILEYHPDMFSDEHISFRVR